MSDFIWGAIYALWPVGAIAALYIFAVIWNMFFPMRWT